MEGLLRIAEREGIYVAYRPLAPSQGILGLYFRDGQGRPIIVLDASLPGHRRLERCVLAEEVGHHFTAAGESICLAHFSYTVAITLSRSEAKALRWAADYLLPVPAFAEAVGRGMRTVDELAEHFDVTPWMVYRRLQFLREDLRRQGLRVHRRDLFAPLLVQMAWGWRVPVENSAS